MARRMFSPQIVGSDAFLEMPTSSRELYFQLGMYADDDGFISPRKIMRMVSATDDDLKVLIGKRFVLPFENGVIVIKHWKMNNLVRKDFYRPTQYQDEVRLLYVKKNGSYTFNNEEGTPLLIEAVNKPLTNRSRRIGKDRLVKDSINTAQSAGALGNEVISLFKEVNPSYASLFPRKPQHAAAERLVALHGLERIRKVVEFVAAHRGDKYFPTIATPTQLEDKWAALESFAAKLKETKREIIV